MKCKAQHTVVGMPQLRIVRAVGVYRAKLFIVEIGMVPWTGN